MHTPAPTSALASDAASSGIRVHPDAVFFVENDRLRVFTRRGATTFASKGIGQLHHGIVKVLDGTVSRTDVLKATPSSHHDLVNAYFDRLLECGAFLTEEATGQVSAVDDPSASSGSDETSTAPVVTSDPSLDALEAAAEQGAPAYVFVVAPDAARDLLLQVDRLLDAAVPVRVVVHPDAPGDAHTAFLKTFADRLAKTPVRDPSPLTVHCAESPTRVTRSVFVPPDTPREAALQALPDRMGIGSPARRSQIPIPSGKAGSEPLLQQVFADVPDRFRVDQSRISEALVTATIAQVAPDACVTGQGALPLCDQTAVQAFASDGTLPAGRLAPEVSSEGRPVPPARSPSALLHNAFDVAAQGLASSPTHPVDLCQDREDDTPVLRHLRHLLRNEMSTLKALRTQNVSPAAIALPDGTTVAAVTSYRARRHALVRAVLDASEVPMDGSELDGGEARALGEDAPGRLLANEQRRVAEWVSSETTLHVRCLSAWNRTVYTATLILHA